MKIDKELLEMSEQDREMAEREERALAYIEHCVIKRYERIFNVLLAIGGLVLLSLPLFNIL